MGAGVRAQRFVFGDDIAPGQRDDEFLAVRPIAHRDVADLRLFDRKRRRLSHLPANQLIEILGPRRDLLKLDQRHLRDRIRE